MKKIIMICVFLLALGTLFVGCTPEKQESENTESEQSGSPAINYELPDEVKDYNFHFEFVPEEN